MTAASRLNLTDLGVLNATTAVRNFNRIPAFSLPQVAPVISYANPEKLQTRVSVKITTHLLKRC